MSKLNNYKGSIDLISGIRQANGQNFALIEANAISVDENDTRLDEYLKKLTSSSSSSNTGTISLPIGSVIQIPYNSQCPENFLQLDGQILNKTEYSDLYSIFGSEYDSDTDSFKLPNQNDNDDIDSPHIFKFIIKAK